MLKKEFREIIVPTLLRLSILLMFPLLDLLEVARYIEGPSYYMFISFTLGLVTIWIASTYGIDAFRNEHKDQALEYLLSFPLSKFKIALYKLIPRISILMVLIAINLVVDFTGFADFEGEGPVFYVMVVFSPVCLVIFFLLSVFREKEIADIFEYCRDDCDDSGFIGDSFPAFVHLPYQACL